MKPPINDFWADPSKWPLDPRDWVLFAKALQTLAPLMEPDWEGDEFGEFQLSEMPGWPATGEPPPFAIGRALLLHMTADSKSAETEALQRRETRPSKPIHLPRPSLASYPNMPAWKPPPPDDPEPPPPSRPLPTVREAYESARELHRPYFECSAARVGRAAKVRRRVQQACLQGELVTGYRTEYGTIREIDESWWNLEDVERRFAWGDIDLSNPMRTVSSMYRGKMAFLYVTRSSLDAFETKFAPAQTVAGEAAARKQLTKLCEAWFERGEGSIPVGAAWRDAAQDQFGIGATAAKRAWAAVAATFPQLSAKGGKPKRPSAGR